MPSFDLFDAGRPSESLLTERFGIRPPELFVRFVQWCFDRAGGDPADVRHLYWRLLNLESDDADSTGYASPFELFSIGDYDGDQVGWVVLAPELGAADHPWIWYLHDSSQIEILSRDTAEFFSQALSFALVDAPDLRADVLSAAEHLGVSISEELGRSVAVFGSSKYFERDKPAPKLPVDVPAGWRHVPAEPENRGVGVLAPIAEFAPGPHIDDRSTDPLEVAAEHGNNGHSASALWHLLTPRARHGTEMSHYSYWRRYVKQAYANLGRPQLAARVDGFDA
jgi:hypothetical protein